MLPELTWEDVPQQVAQSVRTLWPVAATLQESDCLRPDDAVLYHPRLKVACVVTRESYTPDQETAICQKLAALPIDGLALWPERCPFGEAEEWVLVKQAQGYLQAPAALFSALQKPLGGPSPLASTLVGGALLGGLGYLGGRVGERFLPDKYFEKGKLRRNLELLGLGLGALPGAYWGLLQHRAHPYRPGQTFGDAGAGWLQGYPFNETAKAANAGSLFLPTIPVDAFNQVVWNDVRRRPNRFGTKSPWGTNEQALGTPPEVAAAATGLVAGAAAARGGAEYVSPWDVGVTAAMAGGKGLAAGFLAGKVIGALTGLRPAAQRKLQQAGAWGGALTGAMRAVFE